MVRPRKVCSGIACKVLDGRQAALDVPPIHRLLKIQNKQLHLCQDLVRCPLDSLAMKTIRTANIRHFLHSLRPEISISSGAVPMSKLYGLMIVLSN